MPSMMFANILECLDHGFIFLWEMGAVARTPILERRNAVRWSMTGRAERGM